MPLAQCPCDIARRHLHPYHIGVCFPNTRTSRQFPAHCSRSRPFPEWPRSFSLLWPSTCLVVSDVYGHRHTMLPPSCTNYLRKHWSAELQGAAVTCYIPTGRCHDECDTMLCSKFRLQIKTGPTHCNLVIFFGFSRNLEHCRVPHSSWRRPK